MPKLRTKILGIQALAIMVTVVILGGLSYLLMFHTLLSAQQHNLEHLAHTTARDIGRSLTDLQGDFRALMISRDMHRSSDLPLAKYLSRHQDRFPELTLLNQEGREELRLLRQRIVDPKELRNWRSDPLFEQAITRPNKVIISPVAFNPELGTQAINLAMAQVQYFGDRFEGLLIGSVPLTNIFTTLDNSGKNTKHFLAVINAEQQVLHLSRANPDIPVLSPASSLADQALLARFQANKAEFIEGTIMGQEAYLAYQTDPVSHWTVLAVLPADAFMEAPNRLRNLSLLTCLLLLLGGSVVAQRVTHRLTRDIEQLTEHTHRVAAGDLSHQVATTSQDEIAILSTSFNEMTRKLAHTQEIRDHLDTILQSIIDPLLVTDLDGKIRHYNLAATEMLHYSQEQLLGASISDVFPGATYPDSCTSFMEVVSSGPLKNFETTALTCDGESIPILLSCSAVDLDAEQKGMVAILKDISKRKQAMDAQKAALVEAEAARDQVDTILRSVIDGLIVTNSESNLLLMNRAAEELLGKSLRDAFNKPVNDLIPNPILAEHLSQQIAAPTSEHEAEFQLRRKSDSTLRTIQARSAPIQKHGRPTTGFVTLLRDITEERALENTKNEFISIAAHELNTPLTTILGFTEFLMEPEAFGTFSDEERQDFLKQIFDKTEMLVRIVSDMLDLSHIESGQKMPVQKFKVDLNAMVKKTVYRFKMIDSSHQFVLDLDETTDINLFVDEHRMIQVIENLISNASKYSPAGSRIDVTTRSKDEEIQISVSDQGAGMSEEQVARIFDKFYRADATETTIRGLGLGMSIVQYIIQAHDGEIDVISEPNVGTTINITLPIPSNKK